MNSNLIDKMKLNLDTNLINKKNKINHQSSLEEVAQEFESLYVFQMLKSARKAKLADGILMNKALKLIKVYWIKNIQKNSLEHKTLVSLKH